MTAFKRPDSEIIRSGSGMQKYVRMWLVLPCSQVETDEQHKLGSMVVSVVHSSITATSRNTPSLSVLSQLVISYVVSLAGDTCCLARLFSAPDQLLLCQSLLKIARERAFRLCAALPHDLIRSSRQSPLHYMPLSSLKAQLLAKCFRLHRCSIR